MANPPSLYATPADVQNPQRLCDIINQYGPLGNLAGGTLIQVGTPSDANAAAAGVPVGAVYTGTADPHILYVRVV